MNAVLYDAAVLVAADRNERRTWAEHKARLEFGVIPFVPAAVVLRSAGPHDRPNSGASLPGARSRPLTKARPTKQGAFSL